MGFKLFFFTYKMGVSSSACLPRGYENVKLFLGLLIGVVCVAGRSRSGGSCGTQAKAAAARPSQTPREPGLRRWRQNEARLKNLDN